MALRNANSGGIATENGQEQILDAVEALTQALVDAGLAGALPALARQLMAQARDAQGRLRVIVDGTPVVDSLRMRFGDNGSIPGYYSSGSPNAMDARIQQSEIQRTNAIMVRQSRWAFS